jgi:hypothetical protein
VSATADRQAAPVPRLSVVIVVFAGGDAIRHALSALQSQAEAASVEIIVAAEPDAAMPHAGGPRVRVVHGPPGAHPAQLRALGVAAASAPIVACIEDHCRPRSDWVAAVLAAHARSPDAAVIGGAIDKATPDRAIAWAAYLLEYGRYMPPVAGGPAAFLSDCNVSYKRAALADIADVWRDAFHETTVHDAVRGRWGTAALIRRSSWSSHATRRLADSCASATPTGDCSRACGRNGMGWRGVQGTALPR